MQSGNVINTLNKSLTSESDDQLFEDFATRIQTYIDGQKWIKKPFSLSPVVCSQYGWKCIKTNLLECVTCGAKLSANDSKIGDFVSYIACIEKTLSNLKDSHGKHCPWPLTPAPETFVRMILMPKEEALSQFLKRIQATLKFQSFLPKIEESIVTDLGFGNQQILSLCKIAGIKAEDTCLIGKSIISLSATGWIISEEEESKKPILKCNNCLRLTWCGSFSLLNSEDGQGTKKDDSAVSDSTSMPGSSSNNGICKDSSNDKQTSEEPPLKKKRISLVIKKGDPFDPLYEHRPWCLWIHTGLDSYTSDSSNESKKNSTEASNLPGWKIFIKALLKNISDPQILEVNISPSKEQIRNVKSLLEKWT